MPPIKWLLKTAAHHKFVPIPGKRLIEACSMTKTMNSSQPLTHTPQEGEATPLQPSAWQVFAADIAGPGKRRAEAKQVGHASL